MLPYMLAHGHQHGFVKTVVLYLRLARRQHTDRGLINAEGWNVNIFLDLDNFEKKHFAGLFYDYVSFNFLNKQIKQFSHGNSFKCFRFYCIECQYL